MLMAIMIVTALVVSPWRGVFVGQTGRGPVPAPAQLTGVRVWEEETVIPTCLAGEPV
jgi:hypothetical protein